ncbi:GNAT family N-acetyltransferase [Micrococcales bacterium 31B]|nr:GNAT family N-acetyltransferase [Micrococcales bacterium 31B]
MFAAGYRCERLRWWHLSALMPLERELFGGTAWSESGWWSELAASGRDYFAVFADPGGDAPRGESRLAAYGGIVSEPVHGGVSDVQTIAVATRDQGQGLGLSLMEVLLERARARGAGAVMLEVRADNERAMRLYEGLGFVVIARRSNYYGGGVDAKIMRRRPA